jgi:hypothetical protein
MDAHAHPHVHPSTTSDLLGQVLSLICLVHCIATPLVLMLAPALAGFLGSWHPVLLVGVIATAAWAASRCSRLASPSSTTTSRSKPR